MVRALATLMSSLSIYYARIGQLTGTEEAINKLLSEVPTPFYRNCLELLELEIIKIE